MRFTCLLPLGFILSISLVSHVPEGQASFFKQLPGPWESHTSLNYARDLVSDGNSLWIAGGGIMQYSLRRNILDGFHTEDGLISNGVTCLAQDRVTKEFWIGTTDGASRFNAETGHWLSYTAEGGLIDNYVQAVTISHFGGSTTIWFGTRKGLSVFDPHKLEWKSFTTEDEEGLRDNWITCVAVDEARGVVWIGTAKGVSLYDLKKRRWDNDTFPVLPVWIEDLAVENKTGNVWCATLTHGIKWYDAALARWHDLLYWSKPFDALCLALDDRHNILWIGTENGLWSYRLSTGKEGWKKFSANDGLHQAKVTTSILVDEQQLKVWVATDKGIFQYDNATQRWTWLLENDGPVHNDVNKLTLDEQSNLLWLATDGGGISSYNLVNKTWRGFTRENGLFSHYLKSVALNSKDNSLWLGSLQGISIFQPGAERVKRIGARQGLNDANVVAVAVDEEKGAAWIGVWGSDGGLYRYDLRNGKLRAFKYAQGLAGNSVTSLALDGDLVWVGTGSGVSRYDTRADKWRTFTIQDGLSNNAVVTLAVDKKNEAVWVATEWGVNRYDKRQDRWCQFLKEEGRLTHNIIVAIAVDEEGDKVWFGTEGFGVTRYDLRADRWDTFTTRDGLASNYVLSIAIDRKRHTVWLGTLLGGVSRFRYR